MLYLKYRPKTIKQLDNSHAREVLAALLKYEDVPHALLFVGQKGTGKTSAARIVAKALNCTGKKKDDIEPCGKCYNCTSIDSYSHPDVVELDAASNRGIDEIRSLIREAAFSPLTATYRVFIIDEAHMITPDAFNALLKTLEEPPKNVIFILATTNEEKIPKTIISRTFRVNFGKAEKSDIIKKLDIIAKEENVKVDEEFIRFVAGHADSSFRDAIKLFEELTLQKKLTIDEAQQYIGSHSRIHLLAHLGKSDASKVLIWVDKFVQQGGNVKVLIEELLEDLRKALLQKNGVEMDLDFEVTLTSKEIASLMKLLSEAYANLRMSPIESIPLEIAIVEFYNGRT